MGSSIVPTLDTYPWQTQIRTRAPPPALTTYRNLLKEIDTTDRGDLYSALMAKEKDTLEVVNRIVGTKDAKLDTDSQDPVAFYRQPLYEIGARLALYTSHTLRQIAKAISSKSSLLAVAKGAVADNTALFNLGLLLIILAIMMFLCL